MYFLYFFCSSWSVKVYLFFFLNDTPTPEISPLPLPAPLPICHEATPARCGPRHRHHAIAVHLRFECLEGVDSRDDHVRAPPPPPQRKAAAAPAVPRHHD